MTFRILLDEDRLDRRLARALRDAGFDVLTVGEAGRLGESDESHLEFAVVDARVIYSANTRDFARLDAEFAASGRFHAGIILNSNQRLGIGEELRRIQAIASRFDQDGMRGRLEWLGRTGDEDMPGA